MRSIEFQFCLFFDRPNVCTERKEEIIDWHSPKPLLNRQQTTEHRGTSVAYSISLNINPNHCIQKIDKRICTSMYVSWLYRAHSPH